MEVNEEKTSICRPVHFTLLGHGFVSSYTKGDKGKYRLCVAKKSWQRLKMKIKIITRKTTSITFVERIDRLNQLMRGWVHYFKHTTGHQKLKDLDGYDVACDIASGNSMNECCEAKNIWEIFLMKRTA